MHHSLKKRPKISHKTRGALLQELAQTTSKLGSGCPVSVSSVKTRTGKLFLEIWRQCVPISPSSSLFIFTPFLSKLLLQGLFLSRVRNLEYLEHISNWLSNFWQQSIPLGSAVCRSRAVTTKKWWRKTKVFNKIVNYSTTQEVATTNWRFLEHI